VVPNMSPTAKPAPNEVAVRHALAAERAPKTRPAASYGLARPVSSLKFTVVRRLSKQGILAESWCVPEPASVMWGVWVPVSTAVC
jgi:hypothetical protein